MEDKYSLLELNDKEKLLLQSLVSMLNDEDKFQRAVEVIRGALIKESFYEFLMKVSPEFISELLIKGNHIPEVLNLLCEMCDTEPLFENTEFSKHLIKNDGNIPLFISSVLSQSSPDKAVKDLSYYLLLILSEQFDEVEQLTQCVKPLVDSLGTTNIASTVSIMMVLTNLIQPKANKNRIAFVRNGGIFKVISLMKTREKGYVNWSIALIYQLLSEGSLKREIYVKHLIENGFFEALILIIEQVSDETRQQILKILFVMASLGVVQNIIDNDIFLYLMEFIDYPFTLPPVEILYTIMIIQECTAIKGAPFRMREIGLSSRLCGMIQHYEELSKQINKAVLSTIFNLIMDEEMLLEFQFFGIEKQLKNMKENEPEYNDLVTKIQNRINNYLLRSQMISAVMSTLQQPAKIEIENLQVVVESIEGNKKETNIIEGIIEEQPKGGIEKKEERTVEQTQENQQGEQYVAENKVINQNEEEKKEENLIQKENEEEDKQEEQQKIINMKAEKQILKLSLSAKGFDNNNDEEIILKTTLTPRRKKREAVKYEVSEINDFLGGLEKEEPKESVQTSYLSKSVSCDHFTEGKLNDTRRSKGKTVISVQKIQRKTKNSMELKEEHLKLIQTNQPVQENTETVQQEIKGDVIKDTNDEVKDENKLIDLEVSFGIPRFKFICNGSLCNEDQAKMIADLNLKRAKRKHIIMELIETEKSYVNRMKECLDLMYKPLKVLLGDNEMKIAFNCLPQILKLNTVFNNELQQRKTETNDVGTMKIADLFNSFFNLKEVEECYGEYIVTGDSAVEYPFELKGEGVRQLLMSWTNECKIPSNYLIEPVQRFPRYVLLLESLIKETPNFTYEYVELEKALSRIKEITKKIDDKKQLFISQQKTDRYKKYLNHSTSVGTFIYEGVVTIKETFRKTYTAVLFSEVLLLFVEKKNELQLKLETKKDDLSINTKEKNDKYFIHLNIKNSKSPLTILFHSEIDFIGWKNKFAEMLSN